MTISTFPMRLMSAAVAVLAAISVHAADAPAPKKSATIHLDETVISGNQELPKVLYIVPWQDPSGMPTIEILSKGARSISLRRSPPRPRR